ncbi:MAG TPA: SH3 domain-containing protein, partial [Polyangiaceae bacterium]|nr:SH3 domain-containing protein [Polyangiaceae bacterium]
MTSSPHRGERLRALGAGLAVLAVLVHGTPAEAEEATPGENDVDAVARVTSSVSDLRAGPGLAYRVIHRAERGETFAIQGREATGFWLRVYMADGRTAYLLGDTADTLPLGEAGEGAGAPGVFAPPPLASAHGGMAMLGGVFDGDGYAEIRPALLLSASLALEPYVGLVMGASGRSLAYGLGASVNLAPDWAIAPFVGLGAGGLTRMPNDDAFVLREQTVAQARAGGGLLVSLRWRIVLRLEA